MLDGCQFCGAHLATGAVACFRCGKMVVRQGHEGTSGGGPVPTQLGTQVKDQLLERQWRLINPIGQGSVGVVWRAQDVVLDRPVAVKVMHEHLLADPVAIERFQRESRVLAGLEHPHIVPILGVGRAGQQPFLVMKLLEGSSLAELLHQRGGRLPVAEAVPVLSQLCEALDFLHQHAVLHRDLKPSNIVVGADGQTWLLDFGLAHEAGSELTKGSQLLGSAQYLSPEQLHGKHQLDRRADLFSLGCVAYEVFTGQPPFSGEVGEVIAHQLHTTPPDANAAWPDLPPGLGAVLRKVMAKIPLERYPSAGEFAAQLQRVCAIAPAAHGAVSAGAALVVPVRRPSREVPLLARADLPAARSRESELPTGEALPLGAAPALGEERDRPTDYGVVPLPLALREPGKVRAAAASPVEPEEDKEASTDDHSIVRSEVPQPVQAARARPFPRGVMVGLGALGMLVAALVVLSVSSPAPAPPPPAPLPADQRPAPSVVTTLPATTGPSGPSYQLPEPPPAPPSVVTVDPGRERYHSLDYTRFKQVRPAHVEVKGGALGGGPPTLEVRVFGPGHQELKADVSFDGVRKGMSPLKLKVSVGAHLLQVSREPYPVTDMELMVPPGAKQVVEIELLPPGAEGWAKESTVEPRVSKAGLTPPPR